MRIVIFGTGECAKRVLGAARSSVEVLAASDNNQTKWGSQILGVPVVSPATIQTLTYDYVVICSAWASDIVATLTNLGTPRDTILSYYEVSPNDARREQELSLLSALVDLESVESGLTAAARPTATLPAARAPWWTRAMANLRTAWHRKVAVWRDGRTWYPLFCRLPVASRIAFFDSYWGEGYSCNPRALSEYLAAHGGGDWTLVWGFNHPAAAQTPSSIVKVKRLGIAYHYYAARAGVLISNVNFPDHIVKRTRALHLQTMHGTPIKTLGVDIPREFKTEKAREAFLKRCERWDCLLATGRYTAHVARRAFQFNGPVLPFGYPRNDYLFAGNTKTEISRLRRGLGIPEDRQVILFAPTWRPSGDNGVSESATALLEAFLNDEALSQQYVLLVRFHHLMKTRALPGLSDGDPRIIDVSTHPDNRELMLVADALITDYSSIVFDYALLERPIVLLCLDYERYAQETRGVYMDIVGQSPWPVYRTATILHDRLRSDLARPVDLPSHRAFVAQYGEWDQGHASQRVYEEVLLPWVTSSQVGHHDILRAASVERTMSMDGMASTRLLESR